jgi:ABC-type sugar transport system ATPase subunit
MASVAFSGVWKRFGPVEAVRDLTLEAADGELLVLVGPSGSGKTTALRMLAGLESVTEGEVRIGERVVNRVAPRERDIAMVFQDYALYPQMRVYDNLAFGLRRRGLAKAEIDERVRRAADALELGELLRRRPRQLSGGQQQRVALGRALVREPQAFLMDEPLSNLDAQLRVQTRGEIRRLQQEIGTTTLYVTHDQVEAMTMGDRIAVMNRGRLEQVGTPAELYDEPANVFVAGFIGSPAMAFARVRVEREDGAVRLRREGLDLRVPGLELPGGEVTVGVRPEHLVPWGEGSNLLGPLEGAVEYVEALGRETFLGVRQDAETRLVVCVQGRSAVQPGERVAYGVVPEGLRFFDPDSGRARQPVNAATR